MNLNYEAIKAKLLSAGTELSKQFDLERFSGSLGHDQTLILCFAALLLFGVLTLLMINRWLSAPAEALAENHSGLSHRLAVLETLVSDLKSKQGEFGSKMQGEMLFLKHEVELMKEPVERILNFSDRKDRRASV